MSYKDVIDLLHVSETDEIIDLILDTDAFNEQDDQFAIAHAMLSPEKINLLAMNAAPYRHSHTDPRTGMLRSYDEIIKVRDMVDPNSTIPVFKGSEGYLPDANTPVESDAARNMVETVKNASKRVYILAIGCITNVASAILMYPEMVNKASVVWFGANSHLFSDPKEYNLYQDVTAAQVLFNSGIPLALMPARGVTDHLITTLPELRHYLGGNRNEISKYLLSLIEEAEKGRFAASKVIWDIAGTGYFTSPKGTVRVIEHTPILTNEGYLVPDDKGTYMVYVKGVNRDHIFADVFSKIGRI